MKTQVWSLGQEDPLEKEMAITSVFLPGESPWIEEPGGLQSIGSRKSWAWLSDNNNNNKELKTHEEMRLLHLFLCCILTSSRNLCLQLDFQEV